MKMAGLDYGRLGSAIMRELVLSKHSGKFNANSIRWHYFVSIFDDPCAPIRFQKETMFSSEEAEDSAQMATFTWEKLIEFIKLEAKQEESLK